MSISWFMVERQKEAYSSHCWAVMDGRVLLKVHLEVKTHFPIVSVSIKVRLRYDCTQHTLLKKLVFHMGSQF